MNVPINLGKIGASDAAAILGLSDYSTAYDVWLRIVHGHRPEQSDEMNLGKRFERAIAYWYADVADIKIEWYPSGGFEPVDRPWQRFTPDVQNLSRPGEIIEIKRARFALDRHGTPGTDQIADYELAQAQVQLEGLHHLGMPADHVRLVVHDLASDTLMTWWTDRDENLGGVIVDKLAKFWRDHVETKIPPPMTGSENVRRWLEKQRPKDTLPVREPTTDELAAVLEWEALATTKRQIEEREEVLKNLLRESIGEARGLKGSFGSISYAAIEATHSPDYRAVAYNRILADIVRGNPTMPESWLLATAEKVLAVEAEMTLREARKAHRRLVPYWRKEKRG